MAFLFTQVAVVTLPPLRLWVTSLVILNLWLARSVKVVGWWGTFVLMFALLKLTLLTVPFLSMCPLLTIRVNVGGTVVILAPTRQLWVFSPSVDITHLLLENAARNIICVVGLRLRTLCVVERLLCFGTRTLSSVTLGVRLVQSVIVLLLPVLAFIILTRGRVFRTTPSELIIKWLLLIMTSSTGFYSSVAREWR